MIRMLIPIIVVFLAYLLIRSFMGRPAEKPIDVEPLDATSESARDDATCDANSKTNAKAGSQEDDIIDIDPL